MFGFSGEHLLLFTVVLFIFGPKRLPGIGSTLGKTARKFKENFQGLPKGIYEPQFRRLGEKDEPR